MSLAKVRQLGRALATARTLKARERWSRDRLESHQRRALADVVRHAAARSPFLRRHWNLSSDDVGPEIDLTALRPVTRGALMESFDEAVTDPRLRRDEVDRHLASMRGDELLHGDLRVMASSGSTGERGRFVYDAAGWDTFLAGCLRWTRWMGVTPRLPRVRTAAIGAADGKHMTYRGASSLDVGIFRSLRLSVTEPLERLVAALDRHRPHALNAYPSVLALLAEEKLAGRLRASPRVLCTSSELRVPDVTARIERAFGVRPFDCYALTETGVTAVDCELHDGLHVFEDLCIVEIVDDDGLPVPPGRTGTRAFVTNLFNRALPMVRVEISDLLVERPGPCACGRSFRRLAAVEGRADDVLHLRSKDGRTVPVHPVHIRSAMGRCADVVQYRCTFGGARLEIEVVLARGATEDGARRRVEAAVRSFVEDRDIAQLDVAVRVVHGIPREPGGKLKVVRQQ